MMPHPANIFRTHKQRLTYWFREWMIMKHAMTKNHSNFNVMQLIAIRIEIGERRRDLGYAVPPDPMDVLQEQAESEDEEETSF